LTVSNFPNGDTPERATNDVTANSRDQVNLTGTKHHSNLGHLDLRPDLTISSDEASASTLALSCSFPMSRGRGRLER